MNGNTLGLYVVMVSLGACAASQQESQYPTIDIYLLAGEEEPTEWPKPPKIRLFEQLEAIKEWERFRVVRASPRVHEVYGNAFVSAFVHPSESARLESYTAKRLGKLLVCRVGGDVFLSAALLSPLSRSVPIYSGVGLSPLQFAAVRNELISVWKSD